MFDKKDSEKLLEIEKLIIEVGIRESKEKEMQKIELQEHLNELSKHIDNQAIKIDIIDFSFQNTKKLNYLQKNDDGVITSEKTLKQIESINKLSDEIDQLKFKIESSKILDNSKLLFFDDDKKID